MTQKLRLIDFKDFNFYVICSFLGLSQINLLGLAFDSKAPFYGAFHQASGALGAAFEHSAPGVIVPRVVSYLGFQAIGSVDYNGFSAVGLLLRTF